MAKNIDYKRELNPAQYEAATTIDGPVLIIAGAGSGKTRTLVYRVAYMIDEKNIPPEQILLMTFTNAAAKEMKERASGMLDQRCEKITACTYHSFCAMMLRDYGSSVVPPNFSIVTSTEIPNIINFAKKKHPETYKIKGFPPAKSIADIFSAAVNKNISIYTATKQKNVNYLGYVEALELLYKDYKEYKKEKNYVDYDDLLILLSELLDNDKIRAVISNKYKYIMIDEYQDSNNLQEKIVFKLREDNHNLAVVGDDYQSIYAFRGSNINNILSFPDKFPECKKIILDTNYRSTQEILDLANNVMDVHADFGFKKNMVSCGKNGTKPRLIIPNNECEEAALVVSMIKAFRTKGISYKEIAVIERKSASSFVLENLLNKEDIPFDKKGGTKFLEYACVQDILAIIRCHVNYTDELAWFRLLKVLAGIGDVYGAKIAEKCKNSDFLIENEYKKRKFYAELVEINNFMNSIKDIPDEDFPKMFCKIRDFYIYKKEQLVESMDTDDDTRAQHFEKLKGEGPIIDELWSLYGEGKPSAEKMLDALALDESPDKSIEIDDKLTITTIHSAKGLEWDAVIMLDCIDGVFPCYAAYTNKDEDREELRCFYVAMTRAKNFLQIISPKIVRIYGRTIAGERSHYLDLKNADSLLITAKT